MRTAAVMLAQLNAGMSEPASAPSPSLSGSSSRTGADSEAPKGPVHPSLRPGAAAGTGKSRLSAAQADVIRERIMQEMLDLERERMARMREGTAGSGPSSAPNRAATARLGGAEATGKTAEDEGIIRRELDRSDPSAAVFSESWAAKKARIRQGSPYGHLGESPISSCKVMVGIEAERMNSVVGPLLVHREDRW
jgi:phosphatidylinositol 4-kinase B